MNSSVLQIGQLLASIVFAFGLLWVVCSAIFLVDISEQATQRFRALNILFKVLFAAFAYAVIGYLVVMPILGVR